MELALVVGLPIILFVGFVVVLILRCFCGSAYTDHRTRKEETGAASGGKKVDFPENSQNGSYRKMQNFYVMRHGMLTTPLFKWSDHPWLAKEAASQGWACFSFKIVTSPPYLLMLEEAHKPVPSQEGSESMQKIIFPAEMTDNPSTGVRLAMAMLPLPGPKLTSSIFPQQAYFEIIFGGGEGMTSVGLTSSRTPPNKLPGNYPGSIGYSSNGSVHLDGIELVKETKQAEEARDHTVVGCGFDPRRKRVLFTENSKLKHEVSCKLEDFGYPMYPILSTSGEVQVTVNLGQCPFKYEDANIQRMAEPLHMSATSSRGHVCGEESKELFSMGRVDSQFSVWSKSYYDENWTLDSEDLFEIVLTQLQLLLQLFQRSDGMIKNMLQTKNKMPSKIKHLQHEQAMAISIARKSRLVFFFFFRADIQITGLV